MKIVMIWIFRRVEISIKFIVVMNWKDWKNIFVEFYVFIYFVIIIYESFNYKFINK